MRAAWREGARIIKKIPKRAKKTGGGRKRDSSRPAQGTRVEEKTVGSLNGLGASMDEHSCRAPLKKETNPENGKDASKKRGAGLGERQNKKKLENGAPPAVAADPRTTDRKKKTERRSSPHWGGKSKAWDAISTGRHGREKADDSRWRSNC